MGGSGARRRHGVRPGCGDPCRALDTFFPVADITAREAETLRAQALHGEMLRRGRLVLLRELQALRADAARLVAASPLPDVPRLCLHGAKTVAPVYASPAGVYALFPKAWRRSLAAQRHLAPFFEPGAFARAVLAFSTAHDE